jgi:SAM-dependent methyltransferase
LPYFRSITRSIEAAFYRFIELPAPVLDVGCGDGHFASVTFDQPLDVGLDPWRSPLLEAARRGGYRLVTQADGGKMPFQDGYFASAISNSVLEHIPHVELVLKETARVLKPGSPFIFCVPNPGHFNELSIPAMLRRMKLARLAHTYTEWFRRITHTAHADLPDVWQARLDEAGFRMERWWHYLPPHRWHVVEWGHFFGIPSLLVKKLTGRWILAPSHWNLALTDRLFRRYTRPEPHERGVFTFFITRKRDG